MNYQAESIELGILHPPDESLSDVVEFPAAVRILGETNVFAGDCDSGISNIELPGGLTIADLVADCAESATNRGQFVSCIAHLTNDLKKNGVITGQQKGTLQRCAAQADIP